MGWLTSANGALRHIFRKGKPADIPPKPEPALMVLRQGLSAEFYFFCGVFAKEHNIKVVPDRRVQERRRMPRAVPDTDRRNLERRGEPVPWSSDDFIIVPDPRSTRRTPEES